MSSVTQRIAQIRQPRNGYVPVRMFDKTQLPNFEAHIGTLRPNENLHGSVVGLAVDYLTRVGMGDDLVSAFAVSLNGAQLVGELEYAAGLLMGMTSLYDDKTIVNACKLTAYDQIWRGGVDPADFKGTDHLEPDADTIHNIRVMVFRMMIFFETNGTFVSNGFTFQGGYTDTVTSGDGDFLTQDTLWDLKVYRSGMTNKHSLQLLMYYLMGKRSIHPEFQTVTHIGIINPRSNVVRRLAVSEIADSVIMDVERDVLGYAL